MSGTDAINAINETIVRHQFKIDVEVYDEVKTELIRQSKLPTTRSITTSFIAELIKIRAKPTR